MSYDAFLSYAGEDASTAAEIQLGLSARGLSLWRDEARLQGEAPGDEPMLVPGVVLDVALQDAVLRAATFVYLDTADWRRSRFCYAEHGWAAEAGKRTIAICPPSRARPSALREVVVPAGDLDALAEAIRTGLEVARAHATLTSGHDVPARWWWRSGLRDEATVVAHANITALGIALRGDAQACLDRALKARKRWRRARRAVVGAVLAVLATAATVALDARSAATTDRLRAEAESDRAVSLNLSVASRQARNTFEQLRSAGRAVSLHETSWSIGALRDAVAAFELGTDVRVPSPEPPIAVSVSDDGRTTAIVPRDESLTLVSLSDGVRTRVLADVTVRATSRVAVSPSGAYVAVIRADGGAAELVRPVDGSVVVVPDTAEIVDLAFIDDQRLALVRRDGAVLGVRPDSDAQLRRLADIGRPVRAAAITARHRGGVFDLATLDDEGVVELRRVGEAAPVRRISLDDGAPVPAAFVLGRDRLRVCEGRLHVLTRRTAPPSLEIPFTIDERGRVDSAGSMLGSFGSACLASGQALYHDIVRGQLSAPVDGVDVMRLAGATAGTHYALGSSAAGTWLALAGSDGTLSLRGLPRVPWQRTVSDADAVAPDGDDTVVVGGRQVRRVAQGGTRAIRHGPLGPGAARGAFEHDNLGAILAAGRNLVAVRQGRLTRIARTRLPIIGIRPSADGALVAAVVQGRRHVELIGLRGDELRRRVPLPPPRKNEIWDAMPLARDRVLVTTGDGDVLVLASDGRIVRRAERIASPGRAILAPLGRGRFAVGGEDGVIAEFDVTTMTVERRVKAAEDAVMDMGVASSADAVLVRTVADELVVVTKSKLRRITRTRAVSALAAASLTRDGRAVLFVTALQFPDGSPQATAGRWPVCLPCGVDAGRLRARAAEQLGGTASSEPLSFHLQR